MTLSQKIAAGALYGMCKSLVFHLNNASRTASEIFSVKEWRDLETGLRGLSRSLKMAPFDRSYTTFYWSAVVSIVMRSLSLDAAKMLA